jgi:PERQ amino acid-rich with GYF domain-containing protein
LPWQRYLVWTVKLTRSVDDFASTLLLLPLDTEMISDAVYANSTTMNGQHFAGEFIRRKQLADKGIVEKQPGSDGKASSGGGWSEVAKKGGHATSHAAAGKDEPAVGFRVVPGRKKGKK